jgi:tripartite-type tricarboxylate transporter receptor subunit TctC
MRALLLGWLLAGVCSIASGQSYPTKPIKLIIPFPPGNTTDIMSRLIGPKMSERLGQQVVVENRPGASGMLGLDLVAKAPPDGYTIAAGQGGNMVVLPHTSKNIPYDPLRDFAPIAVSTTNYLGIVANPNAPFKTIGEMVAYAKSNPGKLTVATNGEGGFPHLAFEHLRTMSGITYTHVPYKGSAAIATDIMGGQVQAGIDGITGMTPHIKSGRLRLLAVTNKTRVALWPDTPAAGEDVPGYESGGWFGYVAPAGTPRDIVLRLNEEINRAIKSPEVSEKLVNAGLIVVTESPEYFANLVKSDYAKYGKLVKDIGYQPQ